MKKSLRTMSVLLALLMTLPTLASCSEKKSEGTDEPFPASVGEDTADTEETEPETEEDTRIKPDIPANADYGGDEIRFLFWEVEGWRGTVRECRDIYAEQITGEPINDAVYNRNAKIEEAYKVKIALDIEACGDIGGIVSQAVSAGDQLYDVVYPRLFEAASMYQNAYFHNLHNVANIDLTKPWWDANSVESLDCGGYLPCVATSINVNDKDATSAVAFNKTIAAANQLPDIYELVREGKWTYDKLSELSAVVCTDSNGDGTMNPDDDVYGLLGANDVMTAFWYGAGSVLAAHDEDGVFAFTYGSERDINSTLAVIKLMNEPWFMNHHSLTNTDDIYYRQLFEQGHGLFFWLRLDDVTNMREGDAEFGIIPTPKYEETQDSYYSMVSQHTTGLMSIPTTKYGDELDEIGMILEALAAESHYTLIPQYIEVSLKTKNSRDAESADMLDIIISNRVFDPMLIYNFGGFADAFMDLGKNNNTDIASFLKTREKTVGKAIEKAVKSMVPEE